MKLAPTRQYTTNAHTHDRMVTLMSGQLTSPKEKTVIRLTPLLFVAALSACAYPVYVPGLPGQPAEPPGPAPLPPEVAAFLPPGTSPTVVFQDNNGCYLYSIEVTNPPSGFPLRDGANNPICEGVAPVMVMPAAPMVAGEG
jgi:hypothetical protein